jgi:hypothetical protein
MAAKRASSPRSNLPSLDHHDGPVIPSLDHRDDRRRDGCKPTMVEPTSPQIVV